MASEPQSRRSRAWENGAKENGTGRAGSLAGVYSRKSAFKLIADCTFRFCALNYMILSPIVDIEWIQKGIARYYPGYILAFRSKNCSLRQWTCYGRPFCTASCARFQLARKLSPMRLVTGLYWNLCALCG
jgi:hypothetical protein